MKLMQLSASKPARSSTAAAVFGLAIAVAGCSNNGDGETEPTSAPIDPETEASAVVGEMVINGQAYELTQSHWCEPQDGFESGTTVALRVAAYDGSGDVMVYGIQVNEDGSDPSVPRLSAATDPDTNYASEGLADEPVLEKENGTITLRGNVYRSGQDPVPLQAEFVLPQEPGFPGYC